MNNIYDLEMVNGHLLTNLVIVVSILTQLVNAQTKCNFTLPISENDISGIILKNPVYTNNIHSCWFKVKVEPGYGMMLEFQSFNLQDKACFDKNNNHQCCDYLQIGKGENISQNVQGTYCGNERPDPIIFDSNTAWFNFHTDSAVTMDGFKIKVKKFQLKFTEPRGQIESPELRFRYTNNLNLTYIIETEPNSITFLRFERLSIESYNNSCIDYLEIGSIESSTEAPRVICGEDALDKFVIYSNKIYLKFVTDKSEIKSGFSIFYNTIKNVFTEPTGVVKSSDYLMNFTYKIKAPADKLIEIMVDSFDFKKCILNNTEVVIDPTRPSCSQNNDYLMFQNEQGSLEKSLFTKINSSNFFYF